VALPPIGARVAPEAPFVGNLVPSFDLPPVEQRDTEVQFARREIEVALGFIIERFIDVGIEMPRLQSNDHAALSFPPRQPPQLPPCPLPKTRKLPQTRRGGV
jgi:hypothetical protein